MRLLLWALVACNTPDTVEEAPRERLPTAAELNARPPEPPTPQDLARTWAAGEHDDWEGTKEALATFGDGALERAIRSNCLRRRLTDQLAAAGPMAAVQESVALSEGWSAPFIWGPIVDTLRASCSSAACRAEAAAFLDTQRQAHPDAWALAAGTFDLSDDRAVQVAALGQLNCAGGEGEGGRRDIQLAFEKRRDAMGGAVSLPTCAD